MASASIMRLETSSGARWRVRYRRGGRAWPLKHAGSFRTQREARIMRDVVAGELAAGRDPAETLKLSQEPRKVETLRAIAARFESSRVHMSPNGRKNIGSHMPRILGTFGDRDPRTIGFGEIQDWITANTKTPANEGGLEPSSLSRYFATLRQLLEFAGVDPNPARDRRVKLPAIVSEETDPPTEAQTRAILERVGPRWLLPLIVLEQTGRARQRSSFGAMSTWPSRSSGSRVARRRASGLGGCKCPRGSWIGSPQPVRSKTEPRRGGSSRASP
jgi:hypothetical protein